MLLVPIAHVGAQQIVDIAWGVDDCTVVWAERGEAATKLKGGENLARLGLADALHRAKFSVRGAAHFLKALELGEKPV